MKLENPKPAPVLDLASSPAGRPFTDGATRSLFNRVLRLVIAATLSAFALSPLLVASKGACLGGYDADGGYVDSFGNPTDKAPQCITAIMEPGSAVYLFPLLLVLLFVYLAWRKLRVGEPNIPASPRTPHSVSSVRAAGGILRTGAGVIVLFALLGAVWSQIAFATLDVTPSSRTGTETLTPFAEVTITVEES